MDVDPLPLLDDLSATLTTLEHTLAPLLASASLPAYATTLGLPLLERARLSTLSAYAVESLLFSLVRLAGGRLGDARAHPVFAELTRVKGYFDKIDRVERGGTAAGGGGSSTGSGGAPRVGPGAELGLRPTLVVDREAAGRIVRHGIGAPRDKRDAGGKSGKGRDKQQQKQKNTPVKGSSSSKDDDTHQDKGGNKRSAITPEQSRHGKKRRVAADMFDDSARSSDNGRSKARR